MEAIFTQLQPATAEKNHLQESISPQVFHHKVQQLGDNQTTAPYFQLTHARTAPYLCLHMEDYEILCEQITYTKMQSYQQRKDCECH